MSAASRLMEEHNLIAKIMDRFTHDIASEVGYEFLQRHLHNIFSRTALQRAEGRDRSNYEIMIKICESARRLSLSDFFKFMDAIRQDYPHVFYKINEEYSQITGLNLPNCEIPPPPPQNAPLPPENAPISSQNAPIPPENAPLSSQNASSLSQSASMLLCNANLLPQNAPTQIAPIPSHNPSVPPQDAPIPSQNSLSGALNSPIPPHGASFTLQNVYLKSQNTESVKPNMNTGWSLEMCDPKEMATPESHQGSSYNASLLPAEATEPNIASRHSDISLGPAVTYPYNQISNHGNPLFTGSPSQMPSDLSEGNQSPIGSSAMEVSSPGAEMPASCGIDEPLEATNYRREESTELRKYDKAIRKDPMRVYRMESSPRGHCLIINNEKFKNFKYRRGSHKDLENLTRMFQFLNFEVFSFQNKTAEEMKASLEQFAQSPDLGQLSSLAVVILSHGGPNESIYGQDGAIANNCPVPGTFITRLDLQRIFNTTNCPSMKGKPKLFIIQACRGEDEDDRDRSDNKSLGVNENQNESSYYRDDGPNVSAVEYKTESDHPSLELHRAETADMCFLHSSSLGYKAYRSKSEGSPFVQLFTEIVTKHAHEKSLYDIFMMVQNDFSTKMIGSTKMTMPEYFSLLDRKWYFNPPNPPS